MQFKIDRSAPIASGGTSKIYRCHDAIGIRGVCKILQKHSHNKFINEAKWLRALSFSPKIVKLYETVETDDEYLMFMEWCRGGAVRDYTTQHGGMYSANTVASILRGVLRGLVHVHEAGIVHLDIKPGNVLFTDTSDNAEVKLADFGSAMRIDDNMTAGAISGTAWYMSPELLRSTFSPKADVWSVGVMAYQLLTGRMPFDDGTNRVAHIWRKIITEEPIWDGPRWETIPVEALEFVRLCLQKEPEGRPSAAEALEHPWLAKTNCLDRFTGVPLVMPDYAPECSIGDAKTYRIPFLTPNP